LLRKSVAEGIRSIVRGAGDPERRLGSRRAYERILRARGRREGIGNGRRCGGEGFTKLGVSPGRRNGRGSTGDGKLIARDSILGLETREGIEIWSRRRRGAQWTLGWGTTIDIHLWRRLRCLLWSPRTSRKGINKRI
jgi:hypothetical protein